MSEGTIPAVSAPAGRAGALSRLPLAPSRVERMEYYTGPFADVEFHLTRDLHWDLDAMAALKARSRSMLDVGSGWGRVALSFAEAGVAVTAVERSRDALVRFRALLADRPALGARLRIVDGDILDAVHVFAQDYDCVVLGDLTVNAFTSTNVLTGILRASLRALGPAGTLCVTAFTEEGRRRLTRYRGAIMATPFLDGAGHQRVMWSTPCFDEASSTFTQECLVQMEDAAGPRYAFASIEERIWIAGEIVRMLESLGGRVAERVPLAIQGGGSHGASTEMLFATNRLRP